MRFDISQPSYISLREIVSERTQKVIAWVGSGLSAQAKIPTWLELKKTLIKTFEDKARSLQKQDSETLLQQCKEINLIQNNWLAFQRLKTLGEATYKETIRDLLSPVANAKIPKVYDSLWKLRIGGLLNLNIDRLATRARQSQTHTPVTEFTGKDIADHMQVFRSPHPFIVNLHGDCDVYSSWVFTQSELDRLRKSQAYKTFITNCLVPSVVLFVGISADDEAVGGHLEQLKLICTDLGTHYWITNRRDSSTDEWAENHGIRVIRYDSANNDHSGLDEFFKDLLTYIPKEEIAPPIEPERIPNEVEIIDDPTELMKLDGESIRRILNKKAKEILGDSNRVAYEEYEAFVKKYDEAIYRAWYTSDEPGKNELLGYKLEKYATKGAFGKIYKSSDSVGKTLAIKILLEEERKKKDFLQSFRRGVRSMRILSQRNVDGIVGYKEAFEIPAFVVMDWVDGPNLDQAIKSKVVNSWNHILKIACELTRIIEKAHQVPERVLHRDLRPPNIMLQGYHTDPVAWKVAVLDFDLSWHLGAFEMSMLPAGASNGYLAPEQIQKIPNVSTRHAAVDSYGLGMTFFFMIAGKDPIPEENQHKDWEENVTKFARNLACQSWHSLPNRYARLILNTTKYKQAERWDVNQIRVELERINEALIDPSKVMSVELIAEEIFARTRFSTNYKWDNDKLSATVNLSSAAKICMIGDESRKRLCLKISWVYQGGSEGKKIFKWLGRVSEQISNLLRTPKWVFETNSKSDKSLNVSAFIDIDIARHNIDLISRNIDKILDQLKFD